MTEAVSTLREYVREAVEMKMGADSGRNLMTGANRPFGLMKINRRNTAVVSTQGDEGRGEGGEEVRKGERNYYCYKC